MTTSRGPWTVSDFCMPMTLGPPPDRWCPGVSRARGIRSAAARGRGLLRATFDAPERVPRPALPCVRHLGDLEEAGALAAITGVDAEHVADREVVVGPGEDLDRV